MLMNRHKGINNDVSTVLEPVPPQPLHEEKKKDGTILMEQRQPHPRVILATRAPVRATRDANWYEGTHMRTAVGVSSPDSVSIPSATPSRGMHNYACACTSLLLGVISEYEITVGGFVWGDKVCLFCHTHVSISKPSFASAPKISSWQFQHFQERNSRIPSCCHSLAAVV